jgi:hypothetical protein
VSRAMARRTAVVERDGPEGRAPSAGARLVGNSESANRYVRNDVSVSLATDHG